MANKTAVAFVVLAVVALALGLGLGLGMKSNEGEMIGRDAEDFVLVVHVHFGCLRSFPAPDFLFHVEEKSSSLAKATDSMGTDDEPCPLRRNLVVPSTDEYITKHASARDGASSDARKRLGGKERSLVDTPVSYHGTLRPSSMAFSLLTSLLSCYFNCSHEVLRGCARSPSFVGSRLRSRIERLVRQLRPKAQARI